MRDTDAKLVTADPAAYAKALQASALSLRADGRMTGLPRMRAKLEEICALQALGSTVTLPKADRDALAGDAASYNAVTEASAAAIKAAKEAIGE